MHDVLSGIGNLCVVPVVAIERAQDAAPLAQSLIQGGLPCVEVTFRTAAAVAAMRVIAKRGDILVGAGTVLSIDQVKAALDAGARFMVSPGFNPRVASFCVQNDIPFTPGVCTPSDIEGALESGLDVLKYFPAEAFGGLKTLKALSGPYPTVKFIPTGGINAQNLLDYLKFSSVLACGGTWLATSTLITQGRFDIITRNIMEARRIVTAFREALD